MCVGLARKEERKRQLRRQQCNPIVLRESIACLENIAGWGWNENAMPGCSPKLLTASILPTASR